MSNYAPGPWQVKDEATKDDRYPPYPYSIKDANNNTVAYALHAGHGAVRARDNARLLAAAPDMLAALQALHQAFISGELKYTKRRRSDKDPYHPSNTLMSAAISKAEGD